jgi:hypothetical protein
MFHRLAPITIDQHDSPVPLSAEIRLHLERAISAQSQMMGPLSWMTPWHRVSELTLEVSREVQWLTSNAPIDPTVMKTCDYWTLRSWSSRIGLMAQRHVSTIFDGSFSASTEEFLLVHNPTTHNPDGFPESLDWSLWVQLVLTKVWVDKYAQGSWRFHTETWQLRNAERFVETSLRALAKEHNVLTEGPEPESRPIPNTESRALDLWRINLRTACAAAAASGKVLI